MLNTKIFLEQLSKLVSYKTLTGDLEENAEALNYIESLISPQAKVQRIKNGQAEILLASNPETLSPDLCYLVHVDIVSASDGMFKMREENKKVFGRGVSDMKYSIPIGIAILNEIIDKNAKVNFTLAITTDEETGGYEGGKFLAEEYKLRPKALIVPDGGDNLQFVNKSKGIAQFRITSQGKSAHSSRTWEGKNALPSIARLIVELENRYQENSQKKGWNTTLNFGKIKGGISTNQVCDQVELEIDYRYPETNSLEKIESELISIAKDIDSSLQISRLSIGLPTSTDSNLPVVRDFLKVFENEFQQKIEIKPTFGGSDARHFAPYGVPILMIKPLGGDIHCETEWLNVDSTMKFYKAIRDFVLGQTH